MARDLLTDFELMILLAILRLGDQAYGVPIAREIETTGRRNARVVMAWTDRQLVHSQDLGHGPSERPWTNPDE